MSHHASSVTFCALAATMLGASASACAQANDSPARGTAQPPQQITARTFLFSSPTDNLLVHAEPHATLVVGVQEPALVARAREWLTAHRAAGVRFVVAAVGDSAAYYGDGGWGAAGATVLAHEDLRGPMMDMRDPSRHTTAPNAVPVLGFSEVVQMSLGDIEAHAVHQKPGYSSADVTVHIEGPDVLYLGNVLTTDGYPDIDLASGGSIAGMIGTVDWFVNHFSGNTKIRYVPGRGPAIGGSELRDYRDMLTAVRDRVQALVTAGKSDAEIVAARPTRAFDARWGHGRVTPARFTTLVAQSLRKR